MEPGADRTSSRGSPEAVPAPAGAQAAEGPAHLLRGGGAVLCEASGSPGLAAALVAFSEETVPIMDGNHVKLTF